MAKPIGPASCRSGQRALNTVENTKVYTASISSGLSRVQPQPSNDPR